MRHALRLRVGGARDVWTRRLDLDDLCTLIGEQKANISDLKFTERKPDFFRLIIDVDLRDVEHLHMVMTALEAETDVAQVSRHRDVTRKP